jgi:RimJ/RimL family protein N-acetyltransferase
MAYILETQRLKLREFSLDDVNFIVELVNTPGWIKFIGDRGIRTEEQAAIYLETGPMKSYHEHGYGLWLVERKDSKEKIGMCGIIKRESFESPDIGFAFLPAYMRKGYAREIAQATLNYALNDLELPKLLGISKSDNERSIKVSEVIGLKFVQTFHFPDNKEQLFLYST